MLEGQLFGEGQRTTRRHEALFGRIGSQVEEHGGIRQGAGALQLFAEIGGVIVLNAHRGKDHRKVLFCSANACLACDLRGQLIMRQAVAREDRQLLSAHQRVHRIDDRHPCLNHVHWVVAVDRVDRTAVDAACFTFERQRHAIQGPSGAAQHAAQQGRRHGKFHRLAQELD